MTIIVTKAAMDVLTERQRQIEREGWTLEHDDQHDGGELAKAAACYIIYPYAPAFANTFWPMSWSMAWWKPGNERRDLVKAAALLLAEIERRDRANERP